MKPPRFSVVFLAGVVIMLSANTAKSQFGGIDIRQVINSFDDISLLKLVMGLVYENKPLLQDLKDVAISAIPILSLDHDPNYFFSFVLPWAFHKLPIVLENEEFLTILRTFIDEVESKKPQPDWKLDTNDTTAQNHYFAAKLVGSIDFVQLLLDIVRARSVSDLFPYTSTDRQLDEQCYNDTMAFVDRLFMGDTWALDMFDAIGKPTTGIRRGVLYFPGTYDQCMNVRAEIPFNATLGQHIVTKGRSFQGKYCRATFDPPRSLIESVMGDNINHTYGLPLTISLGMCMPDSCAGADIEGLLNLGILGSLFNLTVAETVCTEDLDFKTDDNAHAVIGILGGLILLVIVSSTIELFCLQKKRDPQQKMMYALGEMPGEHANNGYVDMPGNLADSSKPSVENGSYDNTVETLTDNIKLKENGVGNKKGSKHGRLDLNISVDSDLTENILDKSDDDDEGLVRKLLRSFSIFTNLPAVMSTEVKNFDISCLYGIRVITMTWIVLGNTYLYTAQSVAEVPVAADLMDSFDLMKRFTMQAVLSTAFATDTFFLISGCLIAYWFLAKDEMRVSKINVKTLLKFYAGKYWKLTPPYMLVMVMFVYLYTYLGDGPMWPNSIPVADACRKSWWKHLLYVNNLVGVDGVAPEDQCMAWSWYMAATMQFYLISPILLSLMAFSTTMGCTVTGILAVAGVIAAGVKEAEIGGQILTSREDGGQYWNSVFTKPWCRISSYCVGLLLGLVLQRFYHKILNKYIAGLCWLLFACVGVLLVYVPYTQHVDALADWSLPEQGAYEALARPVWAMCVGWVIYACATGYGGPVSDFLSWKGFVPLSRVTFLVYLIHPVLMVLAVYTRRTMLNLNDFQMAYQFVGHVVINYVAAIFAALVFDFPFRNLKRVVQRKTLNSPF